MISEIPRRHGLRPQQSFTWRNQTRSARAEAAAGSTQFAPVVAASAAAILWLILGPYSVPAAYRLVLLAAWMVPALALTGSLPGMPQLILIATYLIGLKLVWSEVSEHAVLQVTHRASEGSRLAS